MPKVYPAEHLRCRKKALVRSADARTPIAETPADWTRRRQQFYANTHARNPVARFSSRKGAPEARQGHEVNKKRNYRLRMEEGLQVRVYHSYKRAGVSLCPQIDADHDARRNSALALNEAGSVEEHHRLRRERLGS